MQLKPIVIKNGATTPADTTFNVVKQEGLRSSLLARSGDNRINLEMGFREEDPKTPGKCTLIFKYNSPAVTNAGVITKPATTSTVRIEITLAPSELIAVRKDLRAFIRGIVDNEVVVEAIEQGLYPY